MSFLRQNAGEYTGSDLLRQAIEPSRSDEGYGFFAQSFTCDTFKAVCRFLFCAA